jgi:hypothetical protein
VRVRRPPNQTIAENDVSDEQADVNQKHTVYLVEADDEDELAGWLASHHQALFEHELNGWYTGALAAGPVAHDARGVVLVRAPYRRRGHGCVSARARRVGRMSRPGQKTARRIRVFNPHTVADSGHPSVLQSPIERILSDAASELALDRICPTQGADSP